jgi:hypothetical protein
MSITSEELFVIILETRQRKFNLWCLLQKIDMHWTNAELLRKDTIESWANLYESIRLDYADQSEKEQALWGQLTRKRQEEHPEDFPEPEEEEWDESYEPDY